MANKQLSEDKINSRDCQEICYKNLLVKFLVSNCDSGFASSFLSSLCSLVKPTQWDKAGGIDLECLGACDVRGTLVKAGYMLLTWCNVDISLTVNIQQALFLFSSYCSTLLSIGNTLHSSSPRWVCCAPGGSCLVRRGAHLAAAHGQPTALGLLRHLYKVLLSQWDATNLRMPGLCHTEKKDLNKEWCYAYSWRGYVEWDVWTVLWMRHVNVMWCTVTAWFNHCHVYPSNKTDHYVISYGVVICKSKTLFPA